MPVGTPLIPEGGKSPVPAGGLPGIHVISAYDNATVVTTNITAPATIDETEFHWVQVPQGYKRVIPYLMCETAVTAVASAPIVRLIGASGGQPNATNEMPATTIFTRLDSAATGGAGITLNFDNSNDLVNGTYQFCGLSTLTGIDTLGSQWIGVVVSTAAGALTGTGTLRINLLFID